MANQKEKDTSSEITPDESNALKTKAEASDVADIQYMPLQIFANHNALKYGVELMGGFYHEQEQDSHYADTEENWHKLMEEFKNGEVK